MSNEARSGAIGHELGSTSTAAKVHNGEEEKPGNVGVNRTGAGGGNDSKGTTSDTHRLACTRQIILPATAGHGGQLLPTTRKDHEENRLQYGNAAVDRPYFSPVNDSNDVNVAGLIYVDFNYTGVLRTTREPKKR